MKTAKMMTIAVIAVLTVVSVPMVVANWEGAEATDSARPTITEAGYSDSGKAFFYYAKFALNEFNVSSARGDTPTAGAGLTIQDCVLYDPSTTTVTMIGALIAAYIVLTGRRK